MIQENVFSQKATDQHTLVDEDGISWPLKESALVGPGEEHFSHVSGFLSYWPGWYSAHPDTLIYRER